MLDELQNEKHTVGLKRVTRAIEANTAKKVFLANDVSPDIYEKIVDLCRAGKVEIEYAESMKQLGSICKIDVSAAVAAILK